MSDAPAPPVLRVDEVSVRLGGAVVLESINFSLYPGELALLAGANGAGKSTLLRAVAGLLPPGGDVFVCGHRPRSLAARRAFVYVPDVAALYEDLTGREHAVFTARVYAQPEAEARVLEWLERFSLSRFLDESPSRHSRGMRQKLALALALGLDMPLLMLDEPFNALDMSAQEVLRTGLEARAAAGGAVLLSAHGAALTGMRELRLEGGRLEPLADSFDPHVDPKKTDAR